MSDLDLRFTDPPKPVRMRTWSYDWIAVARQLRDNPGEWAVLEEGARLSVANAIRQGKISHLRPSDGFEITTANVDRENKPATCDIYLRWVDPSEKENE